VVQLGTACAVAAAMPEAEMVRLVAPVRAAWCVGTAAERRVDADAQGRAEQARGRRAAHAEGREKRNDPDVRAVL
jgi:hypothetical protein